MSGNSPQTTDLQGKGTIKNGNDVEIEQEKEEENAGVVAIRRRYDRADKRIGRQSTKILPNGEKVRGRFIIVEAEGLAPSHDIGRNFAQTEGFPTREDGSTLNDRDYQHDKSAQQQVMTRSLKYDGRAVQDMPIIDKNGIVLSGNDRTMSGQLASKQGTDTEYLDYLADNAEMYGLMEEQVKGMNHPRLVFELEENMPYTVQSFAIFNANERKTQNNTEKAIKVGKTISEKTITMIAQKFDEYESIAECLQDIAGSKFVVDRLVEDGILQRNDVEGMVNESGLLNATGKEFVQTALLGIILNEESIRIVGSMPFIRNIILSSLNEILQNRKLSDRYTLNQEINEAIKVVYEAHKNQKIKRGEALTLYYSQIDMFTGESNMKEITIQLLVDILNGEKVKELKKVLSLYNVDALSADSGELDMFGLPGSVKTKEQILKEVIKRIKENEQRKSNAKIGRVSNGDIKSKESGGVNGTESANERERSGHKSQRDNRERVTRDERGGQQREVEDIKPIGKGEFGNIYDQFKGKVKEAVEFLKEKKEGEVLEALYHKDVGYIDLVWGKEGTARSDGYGLSKLIKYHPEVVDNLQEIINDMHITKRTENRIQLESDKYKASVRLTWNNERKTWLLTAFQKNSVSDNTTDTDETLKGKRNATATSQNTISNGKGTTNIGNSITDEARRKIKERLNKLKIKGIDGLDLEEYYKQAVEKGGYFEKNMTESGKWEYRYYEDANTYTIITKAEYDYALSIGGKHEPAELKDLLIKERKYNRLASKYGYKDAEDIMLSIKNAEKQGLEANEKELWEYYELAKSYDKWSKRLQNYYIYHIDNHFKEVEKEQNEKQVKNIDKQKQETIEQEGGYVRKIPKDREESKERIKELLQKTKQEKSKVERVVVSGITNRQKQDLVQIGVVVDDSWVHSLENSAVLHTEKQHGNSKIENNRKQEAITESDYELIPDILENYDKIEKSINRDNQGREVVIYKKEYADGYIYYLEEIREKRKSLAFKTMYKKKKGSNTSDGFMQNTPTLTSETASDTLTSEYKGTIKSGNSITDEAKERIKNKQGIEKKDYKTKSEAEFILEQPLLTEEEIRNSGIEDELKTLAIAYIKGNRNFVNQISYINTYNNVRRSKLGGVGENSDTEGRTTQLDSGYNNGGERLRSGVQSVEMGSTGSGKEVSGTKESSLFGNGGVAEGNGERSDKQDVGRDAGDKVDTTGGKRRVGSRDDRNSRNDNSRQERDTAGDRNDGKNSIGRIKAEHSDSAEIRRTIDELNDLLEQWVEAGKEDLSLSIIGMNNKQIEIVGKIALKSVKLGSQFIKAGVTNFVAWANKIKEKFAQAFNLFGWNKAEIDEFIKEIWESDYTIEGKTMKLSQWAEEMSRAELRKIISRDVREKKKLQDEAENIKVELCNEQNIRDTLPFLLPEQQEDVIKAERQFFSKEHKESRDRAYGKGFLFTNGTGTGKTFTGGGIVKRFVKQGKGRILIVTPTQKKITDWKNELKWLNIEVTNLEGTKDKGEGVVITTYANLRQNKSLFEDTFDLIVYDESHKIIENKKGEITIGARAHFKLSNKDKDNTQQRFEEVWKDKPELRPQEIDKIEKDEELEKWNKEFEKLSKKKEKIIKSFKSEADRELYSDELHNLDNELTACAGKINKIHRRIQDEVITPMVEEAIERTKVVFLSATPFNTKRNLNYVEGYIFSYPLVNGFPNEEEFFTTHFGSAYRIRYGKLNNIVENPEAVRRQEIEFANWLMNDLQTMSTRILDNGYDYSRQFPLVALKEAGRINECVSKAMQSETPYLREAFIKTFFDYNYSRALFETMKIGLIKERIQQHLDKGRKVVIFHQRQSSQQELKPPFKRAFALAYEMINNSEKSGSEKAEYRGQIDKFKDRYDDLLLWEQGINYAMPREQLSVDTRFADKVVMFSGKETVKQREKAVAEFNKDDSGKDIIIVQEQSGKEGISLHDRTGKHQRVLIGLGLPQSPVTFIQIEGRIYRIGNKSNAIIEYPLLGLMSEISLFADGFNSLVGTTENLAMGKYARNLQQSISEQVLEDSGEEIEVSDSQGIGGREKDGMGSAMDEQVEENNTYEGSILDYYGNQKLNSNRSNRAGKEFYPTPEPVGWKMVEWADIKEGDEVLEPSAGQGAIARYVPRTNKLTAIEPSMSLRNTLKLRAGGLGRRFVDDIFENHTANNKYEVILMNPPFENRGKLAQAHIEKALDGHLRESGRCIAIMPNGSSMNTWEENFLKDNPHIVKTAEILLPTCAFERAGTKVATKIVIYNKIADKRNSNSILEAKKKWYNYTEQKVDLRECKDVKELFEKLKEVEVQERKIPLFLKRYNQAKKTLNDFKTLPIVSKGKNYQNKIVPEVLIDSNSLWVRCKTIDYYNTRTLHLHFNSTPYEYGLQYESFNDLIKYIPESLKETIYKIKDSGGQTIEVNAKDVIEEYYKLCMTTIENVSDKTPQELLKLADIYNNSENKDELLKKAIEEQDVNLHKVKEEVEKVSDEEAELRDVLVETMQEAGIEVVTDNTEAQRVLDKINGKNELDNEARQIDEVNNKFNKELQEQIDGTLAKDHTYQLGRPSEILQSAGIPNLPIELKASRLNTKSKQDNHPFELENVKDLVKALQKPLAIFEYGDKTKAQNIIIEIQKDGKNFLIGISISPFDLQINDVRGIFPKDNSEWLNWITQGKALYLDKKRIQTLIDQQRINLAEVEYLDLNSVAKVVENFENPPIKEEKSDRNNFVEHRVYHGSGAEFTEFDHSHMGEGEGQQAYGWGTYVTEVNGIAREYATTDAERKVESSTYKGVRIEFAHPFEREVLQEIVIRYVNSNGRASLSQIRAKYITELENHKRASYNRWKEAESSYKEIENIDDYEPWYKQDAYIRMERWRMEYGNTDSYLNIARGIKEKELKVNAYSPILYSVEIPDDNGRNYIYYENALNNSVLNRVAKAIDENSIAKKLLPGIFSKSTSAKIKDLIKERRNNKRWYDADLISVLGSMMGSPKKASKIMRKAGYVGISYPAQYRSGGRKDGARNYVIFDEKDLKIVNKIRLFKTSKGEVYGFVKDGKIYIDTSIAKADTPIHEYTHLWARALREHNPQEWANIVRLLKKEKSLWEYVKQMYPELTEDNDIADEVLAHYSGKRGAERLRQAISEVKNDKTKSVFDRARIIKGLQNVKEALNKFWHNVADFLHIHYTTAEEVADRVLYDMLNKTNPNDYINNKKTGKIQGQRQYNAEEQAIIDKAKAEGTYMKAPNGKPTNLTERQWVQVRTKAFKEWFGDWEKSARIEKLRKSESIVATGEEYKGKYELNNKSADSYIKDNLRGEYTNKDTGDKIKITRTGAEKVTRHDAENEIHLKSIALIPQMLENAIFITEETNEKEKRGFDSYRYYVVGLKIGNIDYTAKLVVGVKNGQTYYDHALTEISKEKLLDERDRIKRLFINKENFNGKDTRLFSIISENSSKVVDENGEPRVVYHITDSEFTVFDREQARANSDVQGFFFSSGTEDWADMGGNTMGVFLNIKNPTDKPLLDKTQNRAGEKAREELQSKGYDGTIEDDEDTAETEYCVFEPNQIKSATDNTGAFSKKSNDIRFRMERQAEVEISREDKEQNDRAKERVLAMIGKAGVEVEVKTEQELLDKVAKVDSKAVEVLQSVDGELFGFVYKGKIYINSEVGNTETLLHEWTHLWDISCRRNNSELWERGKALMKQTPLWAEIRAREEYSELSDDELASEIHARLVGKEGERLLRQMQQEALKNGDNATILKRQNMLYKLKEWLRSFWQWVKGTQVNGVENISLEEFIGMPIAELVERSKAKEIDKVNNRFNKELENFKDGKMLSNKKFDLGRPGKILITSGVSGRNITMTQSVLKKHLEKHNIYIDEIKDLVRAINEPMMVYEWGSKAKSIIIITNIKRENGDKISVAIRVAKEKGELEVNEIVSIHGKEGKRFINDMLLEGEHNIENSLKYVQDNKKEVLDWLAMETPKVSSQTEQELHIAKVVENFENLQKAGEKNIMMMSNRRRRVDSRIEPNEDFYIDAKEWTDTSGSMMEGDNTGETGEQRAGSVRRKTDKDGLQVREMYGNGIPKIITGINKSGNVETNRWVMAMQLRLNGGWKWDNEASRFVRKKQWFNSIDRWFDWASPVRKLATIVKLRNENLTSKNPYYMLLNVDNKTDGLISTRVTTREVSNEMLIERIAKESGLSRKEIRELLIINSMPGRTARMIYGSIEKIQEKIDRNIGTDTFLSLLAESEREGVDIGGLLNKDKKDVILEQWEIEMITDWMECYNGITEEQVQSRYEQVIKRYILPKGKEAEKTLKEKVKKLLASESFRDSYSYNANTYSRSYGLYKGENKYDGQVQGWNGEQDMYLMRLYQRFYGTEDSKSLHSPQELKAKAEELLNGDKETAELYDRLLRSVEDGVWEMNKFALDYREINEGQWNNYALFNDKYWLPLRGWDSEYYKAFGEDSDRQRLNERERMRGRIADDPLKYFYGEYRTLISDGVKNEAKRSLVEMIEDNAGLFTESDVTANSVQYCWRVKDEYREKWRKRIEWSRDKLPESMQDGTYVLTPFAPEEQERDMGAEVGVSKGILMDDDLNRLHFVDRLQVFGEEYDVAYTKGREGLDAYTWRFKDGEVWHKIVLPDKTLVSILNSRNMKPKASSLKVMQKIAKVTRFMARMMTSRNITFLFRNFIRDYQEALFVEVPGMRNYRKNFNKYVWQDKKVLFDIINKPKDTQEKIYTLREKSRQEQLTDKEREYLETYKLYNEWLEMGGSTGVVYELSSINANLERMRSMIEGNRLQRLLGRQIDSMENAGLRNTANAIVKGKIWNVLAKGVSLKYVEQLAEVTENLVRFASYRAFRQEGMNKLESAYQSREATVNFSRWGSFSKTMNMLFPFFSATMNALYRDARLLVHNPSNFMKRAGMYFALGGLNVLVMSLIGGGDDDDDKNKYKYVSDYMKYRGMYIPVPYLNNWFIPVPQSCYPIYALGILSAQCVTEEKTKKEALVEWLNMLLDMSPESLGMGIKNITKYNKATDKIELNNGEDILYSVAGGLTSGVGNVFFDLAKNENYLGGRIIKSDSGFGKEYHKTRWARSKDNSYVEFENLAWLYNRAINHWMWNLSNEEFDKELMKTGGEYVDKQGKLHKIHTLAPEDIQHIFEGILPSYTQPYVKAKAVITGRKENKIENYPIMNAIISKTNKERFFWEANEVGNDLAKKYSVIEKNISSMNEKDKQLLKENTEYKMYKDYKKIRESVFKQRAKKLSEIDKYKSTNLLTQEQKKKLIQKKYNEINNLYDNWINKYHIKSLQRK